ncbi:hypothetical protein [Aquibacillus albus]|uniref:Sporulation protein n=1 Tax=Aquibacillus albus TaxID=1168171 RepID=A0ABS2MZH1_9BACI|nr:hypothetical protein [Aquibacillus albus]MBM7571267.1 hypothetical protein [Aquibacillus albus]
MKYITAMVVVMICFLLLNACTNELSELFSNQHSPLGIDETEMTDENYLQIDQPGPRTFDQTGETGDVEADKEVIRDAANRMPSVTVESITIDHSVATVYVNVDEPLNENEKKAWRDNILTAIKAAMPRYELNVIINERL